MMTSNNSRFNHILTRAGMAFSTLALAAAISMTATQPAEGSGIDHTVELRAESEIEQLSLCYARGTDAIGRGDLQAGRSIYQKCFTDDAIIGASYPGADPSAPPDLVAIGPNAWADIVNDVFSSAGYLATQHMMTNIVVNVQGNKATMSSYLAATHVIDSTGSIDLAHGTYVDEVVRTPKGWRIKKRTLNLITFLRLESPTP